MFNMILHFLSVLFSAFLGAFFAFVFNVYREEGQQQIHKISDLKQTAYIFSKMYAFQKELRDFIVLETEKYLTFKRSDDVVDVFLENFDKEAGKDKSKRSIFPGLDNH